MIQTTIQNVSGATGLPRHRDFRRWVEAALEDTSVENAELTLRLTDEEEMRRLNKRYRDRDAITNVLSFPYGVPSGPGQPLLGDIALCVSVIRQEAREYGLRGMERWAHMVVHGVLHICGFDHESDDDARRMEALEGRILGRLGFADPYS